MLGWGTIAFGWCVVTVKVWLGWWSFASGWGVLSVVLLGSGMCCLAG